MTPNPRYGSPSGDATLAIQRLARQTGADVQELQTLYLLDDLSIGVDVNFGDPISPGPSPVTVPPLVQLGRPPVAVLGYPLTIVLAEKIVTALDRGVANTRWRDFADIYTLAGVHPLKAQELPASLAAVAAYRQVELRPLKTVLASMPTRAQPKWLAWRRRVHRERELPQEFAEVVQAVSQFADPVLDAEAVSGVWRPHSRIWQS